jgi:hypothetical protein
MVWAQCTYSEYPPPLPVPPHVHIDFVVAPPGCGRSATDFWGWDAHTTQLRCPDDNIQERGVPGGALNLNSTGYPDHGRYGDLLLQGKIPAAEPGIEPGTSYSDHQATRLVTYSKYKWLTHYVPAILLVTPVRRYLLFGSIWQGRN